MMYKDPVLRVWKDEESKNIAKIPGCFRLHQQIQKGHKVLRAAVWSHCTGTLNHLLPLLSWDVVFPVSWIFRFLKPLCPMARLLQAKEQLSISFLQELVTAECKETHVTVSSQGYWSQWLEWCNRIWMHYLDMILNRYGHFCFLGLFFFKNVCEKVTQVRPTN